MATRVKCAASTREIMLVSARRRFVEESYENVSLRDIARDAGVDVALVGRYFGSKDGLFHEVLRGNRADWLDPSITERELPAFLSAMVLGDEEAEHREDLDRLLIMLRSASSPKAAELVRTTFHDDVIKPVSRLLSGDDAELRVGLSFSIMTGASVMRSFLAVQPMLSCAKPILEQRLLRLLTDVLSG